MASPTLSKIDLSRIPPMGFTDGMTKAVFCLGDNNQVRMVRHQTIRPDLHTKSTAPLRHEFQIHAVVILREKSRLPTISTLGDVMGNTRYNRSGESCHLRTVFLYFNRVKSCVWC